MGPEWIIVGIVAVVVLFGAKKLPEMARSVGRAQGEFKKGLKEGAVEEPQASEPPSAEPPSPAPSTDQQSEPSADS
jgi:sec-independent protein translocase protein TatA